MQRIVIAKNTLYQVIARIVSSGTSFLIVILIARHFGILGYGDVSKITAYVSLFYFIADFGFNAIFLQREDNRMRFRDLLYPRVVLAFAVIFLANMLAVFLPYNAVLNTGFSPLVRFGIFIFSLTILTESILYTCLAIFQRELSYDLFLFSELVGNFVTLAVIGLLIISNAPLFNLLYAFIFGGVMQCAIALFLTEETLLPIRFDTKFFLQLTRETLPIGFMLFFNLLYFRLDMILLAIFKSTHDVAIYDLAYKFFDFLIALPLFLSNALYPSLLEHQKNSRIESEIVKKVTLLFFTLSLPLVIFVWFASPLVVIVKQDFLPSVIPLRILALSLPIFFATSILQWILIARRQQKLLMSVYLIATILNLLLNLYFIPHYSYLASATTTGICELIVGIILGIIVFMKS